MDTPSSHYNDMRQEYCVYRWRTIEQEGPDPPARYFYWCQWLLWMSKEQSLLVLASLVCIPQRAIRLCVCARWGDYRGQWFWWTLFSVTDRQRQTYRHYMPFSANNRQCTLIETVFHWRQNSHEEACGNEFQQDTLECRTQWALLNGSLSVRCMSLRLWSSTTL